jgi:hypothetical protein
MANISPEQLGKRSDVEEYDLVVLGSGDGGKLSAGTYAKEGHRLAVPQGVAVGYEDVFTKIDLARKHYAEIGLGAEYIEKFIR